MYIVISYIISLVTIPGVIFHELAHQICCRIAKVPVYKVCYYQFDNPSGYVIFEPTDSVRKNLFITLGPFFLNTLCGLLILMPTSIQVFRMGVKSNPILLFLAWLGISILMHAFPSRGDAKVIFHSVIKSKQVHPVIKIIVFPVIILIWAISIGSVFWLDLAYAIALAWFLPDLLIMQA